MSGLTDIFAASPDAVRRLDRARGPSAVNLPTVQAKNSDIVKLARLEAILTASAYSLDELDALEPVTADGPWIIPLRPPLTNALSDLDAATAETAGRRWAATDEWVADGATGQEVYIVDLLRSLSVLAREAVSSGQSLYLWWSL